MRASLSLTLAASLACLLLAACDYEDDDDCHTHYYSTGVIISHCHDDDDFDDDDFDDDDFDDDFVHVQGAPAEVAVLLTDNPLPGLQSVLVGVAEVSLLSPEVKPQVVHAGDGGRRVELLSLREEAGTRLHELLAGRTAVAPATYDAVRLRLASPSIVLESGVAHGPSGIDCPAECTVEVKLTEPLLLGPGELAFLVLDVLVDRSLTPPGAESDARWTLRPAVAVQVLRDSTLAAIAAPLEAQGIVRAVDAPGGTVRLELDEGAGVIDVRLDLDTRLFAADLEQVPLEQLAVGERLSVRGTLRADGSLAAASAFAGATFRRRGLLREVREDERGLRLVLEDEEARGRFEVQVFEEAIATRRRLAPTELRRATPGQAADLTVLRGAPGRPPVAVRIDLDVRQAPARASTR